jgi:4-amino-4-deoxy-L-arabinose transferase-like glycosyltransferase
MGRGAAAQIIQDTSAAAVSHERSLQAAGDKRWLVRLLLLFLLKGVLLVAVFDPFTGHDEVDHFAYIERLAQGDGLGVVGETRLPAWTVPYQAYVADYPYNAEMIQPPLYHVLLVPLYWAIPGDHVTKLLGLRLVSVVLGAVVVWLAYLIAATIFPDEPHMRAAVPIFVALQPQFSFEAAIVNHDILLTVLASCLMLLLVRGVLGDLTRRRLVVIGLVAGAGLWTKASFGLMLPVAAAAIAIVARDQRWPRRRWLQALALGLGLPLLIASPWFVRSYLLYGDPTGAQRLREIPGFGEQAAGWLDMIASPVFWRGRLEDFWGNYGWRLIPFDPGTYTAIYVLWGIAGIGLLALIGREVIRRTRQQRTWLTRQQWQAVGLIGMWVGALIWGVLYVGTIQFTQSRFAFPAMAGFGLLTAVGYAAVLPRPLRPFLPLGMFVALVLLNVITAIRFVIPFYFGTASASPH